MKIGILTQTLHNNYGGLLQAFALQKALKNTGHDVWTINLHSEGDTILSKIRLLAEGLIGRFLLQKKVIIRDWPTQKENEIISANTRRFVNENIRTTEKYDSSLTLSKCSKYGFEAFIVGSDQVWRPRYSPNIFNFFLDFVENANNVKRIAYAASFGVDDWEFTPEQTEICARLAKKFNAVSVREESAVKLCNEKFGVDALHVLDPTMLLNTEDYIALVEKDNIPNSKGNLMVYVLDKSPDITKIEEILVSGFKLKSFYVMAKRKFTDFDKESIEDCIFPPVTAWLRGFMDAEFVVTDSFHGTVFSILFNKPFITIGNQGRGLARFTSLLKLFNLENRLIQTSADVNDKLLHEKINWEKVNSILREKKEQSFRFLNDVFYSHFL